MNLTIAGKYDAIGVLGEGGTGIVYDAVRIEDGASVALKVMHPHLAGDAQIRGRFTREAAILRRLEGPNIASVLEFGEVPGEDGKSLLFLAQPKIVGPSLEQVLERDGLLPVPRALTVLLEICAALRTAHAQAVIHRDLKPANVLLEGEAPPTSVGKVVVVDFGMSKIVTGAGTGTTNLTTHNMVFGTPEYMSPEQARGDELDARCDIYAAGIILYRLLTGTLPFTGDSPLKVLTAHLTSDMPAPSLRAPPGRVTPALETVILGAVARDRDARYPSAAALAAAIAHAQTAAAGAEGLAPSAFHVGPEAFAATVRSDVPPSRKPSDSATRPLPAVARREPDATPGRAPSADASSRIWIVVWIAAAAVSIAAGVYFALR